MYRSKNKISSISIAATLIIFIIQLFRYSEIVSVIQMNNISVSESLLRPIIISGIIIMTIFNIVINYNILKVIFQITHQEVDGNTMYKRFILAMMLSLLFQTVGKLFLKNMSILAVLNPMLNMLLLLTFFNKENKKHRKPILIYGFLQMVIVLGMNLMSGIYG